MNKKTLIIVVTACIGIGFYGASVKAPVNTQGQLNATAGVQNAYGKAYVAPATSDTGYPIVNYSLKGDIKTCQGVQACKQRCDVNPVLNGSKVPCKSKKYPLLRLCYEACDQVNGALKTVKQDSNATAVQIPIYNWCTMYIQCLNKMMGPGSGWPFRCANIYCAFVDPEDKDTATRNLAGYDKKGKQFSDDYDTEEALPVGFQDAAASEF